MSKKCRKVTTNFVYYETKKMVDFSPQRGEKTMTRLGRREFLKSGAWGMVAASFDAGSKGPVHSDNKGTVGKAIHFGLGLASYTLREFSLEQTITMTKRLALERIVLKSMHLPLESPEADIAAAAQRVRTAGLDLYGCGVVYMTNEAEVEQGFRYAKAAGLRMIVGAPNPELLGLVEKEVKEFDIALAIHNHGPEDKLYPTPASVYERIAKLDHRIGLCIDVGHTMRAGVDPSEAAQKCADRLLDFHVKDVTSATKEGDTIEMGRGVIDIPKFVRTILKLGFAGTLAFEFEKDGSDPLPGLAESVGYLRGVLATL
jgi:sugar phosphate isomerase/epimerase